MLPEGMVFDVVLDKDNSGTVDLNNELQIKVGRLREELVKQPGKFAYFGVLWALSSFKSRRLKARIKALEAELDQEFRQKWPYKAIRPTEPAIRRAVVSNPRLQKLQRASDEADKQTELLLIAKQAFEQRKDMLIQISANNRGEMKGV